MVDFVVEFTAKEDEDGRLAPWMIWTDRSSNQHVGGIGVILQSPKGDLIECTVHLQFSMTNNKAEYEVVLTGLYLVKAVGTSLVVIHNDFQVIIRHINEDYEAKGERMKEYLSMVKERVNKKFLARFVQISREEHEQVDRLAKSASTEHMVVSNQVFSFIQYLPAIDKIYVQVIPIRADWMAPIVSYLQNGTLLEDHNAS